MLPAWEKWYRGGTGIASQIKAEKEWRETAEALVGFFRQLSCTGISSYEGYLNLSRSRQDENWNNTLKKKKQVEIK